MAKAISGIKKKRGRGRPRVGSTGIMVRMPPAELAELDKWIARQEATSRPEAIRQLVKLAIGKKEK